MGSLNEKFFTLFKKSVPFSPIMNIESFISEFVCDVESKVDIMDMQDNIRYYKQLEQEVKIVKERIERLEEIERNYGDYEKINKRYLEQSYLMDRADNKDAEDSIKELGEEVEKNNEESKKISSQLNDKNKLIEQIRKERDKLMEEKFNSDLYKKSENLKRDKDTLQEKVFKIEEEMESLERKIRNKGFIWRENIKKFTDEITENDFNKDVLSSL